MQADRKPAQRSFVRLHSAPLTTLLIATYVPAEGCPVKVYTMQISVLCVAFCMQRPKGERIADSGACMQDGDLLQLMSIMNKQDYARWHSYEFMLSTRTSDPTLRPPGHPEVRKNCWLFPCKSSFYTLDAHGAIPGVLMPPPLEVHCPII